MRAKIYQPARNTMQSGSSKTDWVLEPVNHAPKKTDPLMGWSGSSAPALPKLRFPSKEAAVNYAEAQGIEFAVIESAARNRRANIRPHGYAENFATNRRMPWTH